MISVTLTPDLEAWANAEVEAGRGANVQDVANNAIRRYRAQMEAFRQSLDDAEAESDREGWLDAETVFEELDQRYADPS
jgi:Arc/MetJ-type ribon-helix-helix transcriptional regulator